MQRINVRSAEDALAYLVGCTLATVSRMAMNKSRKKGEFERQISIAQNGVDWIKAYGVSIEPGSRTEETIKASGVQPWAERYMPEHQ